MTTFKNLIASIFIFAFVLQLVQVISYGPPGSPVPSPGIPTSNCTAYTPPSTGHWDCGPACIARCCKSGRPNLCLRACGTCCNRCNCVPSGTQGNYDECPCYRDMKGKPPQLVHKCP